MKHFPPFTLSLSPACTPTHTHSSIQMCNKHEMSKRPCDIDVCLNGKLNAFQFFYHVLWNMLWEMLPCTQPHWLTFQHDCEGQMG